MKRQLSVTLLALVISGASYGLSAAQPTGATATLYTQGGDQVGTVTFTQLPGQVQVDVNVAGLPPGFHGFHVHTNGICDASVQFTSAGGHMDLDTGDMMMDMGGGHAGDMTNLYMNGDGSGSMRFTLDRFSVADLLASGGRSV